jgi:hypothetical protein
VKIAIIALPIITDKVVAPPLPLSYVAALLDQRRHIVRIHDLAVCSGPECEEQLRLVRGFRPHIILLVGEDRLRAAEVRRSLADMETTWLVIHASMRGVTPSQAVVRALSQIDESSLEDNQRVIVGALLDLRGDLDYVPSPARHLLPIERYGLRSPSKALQTNVLIGQPVDGHVMLRNPRLIVSELRSIAHEYGIWHIVFDGLRITDDAAWLHDFLYGLIMARLGVKWEATVAHIALTPDLLRTCQRAGCEALTIEFDVMQVLDVQSSRQSLNDLVREAHALDLLVYGHVLLEPQYSSVPTLVDLSATFGLDDIRFSIQTEEPAVVQSTLDLAESRYRSLQSRQFFVSRFGSYLGTAIWQVGRIGLLGRNWQRFSIGKSR